LGGWRGDEIEGDILSQQNHTKHVNTKLESIQKEMKELGDRGNWDQKKNP